jgi:hypothetical protein
VTILRTLSRRNGSVITAGPWGRTRAIAQRVERRFPKPKVGVRVLVALLLMATLSWLGRRRAATGGSAATDPGSSYRFRRIC